MYFTIKKHKAIPTVHPTYGHTYNDLVPNDIEELKKIKDLFGEFSEIELRNELDPHNSQSINYHDYYDYYELTISNLRKLKLQSLKDENIKQKVIQLQSILYNEDFITLYEEKPNLNSGTSGYTGTNGTSGSSGFSEKSKTLNFNLNIQKVETKKIKTKLSVLDQLKLLFEEKIEDDTIEI